MISIHALREEGDNSFAEKIPVIEISIHALREEGDRLNGKTQILPLKFQSTPSARRATVDQQKRPREPPISIHALREEGDDNQTFTDLING